MNPRILSCYLSWLDLDEDDRNQFGAIVRTFEKLPEYERQQIIEHIRGISASLDLGPLNDPCPRCGR